MRNLYQEAGLIPCGIAEDGEMQYLGSVEQWNRYEQLEAEHDCHAGPEDGCQVCDVEKGEEKPMPF